jgi:hypothetical protein
MSKLWQRVAAGWTSMCAGPRDFERALKREWRAVRTGERDRAHLATLMRAPAIGSHTVESPPAPAPSSAPPVRDQPPNINSNINANAPRHVSN